MNLHKSTLIITFIILYCLLTHAQNVDEIVNNNHLNKQPQQHNNENPNSLINSQISDNQAIDDRFKNIEKAINKKADFLTLYNNLLNESATPVDIIRQYIKVHLINLFKLININNIYSCFSNKLR